MLMLNLWAKRFVPHSSEDKRSPPTFRLRKTHQFKERTSSEVYHHPAAKFLSQFESQTDPDFPETCKHHPVWCYRDTMLWAEMIEIRVALSCFFKKTVHFSRSSCSDKPSHDIPNLRRCHRTPYDPLTLSLWGISARRAAYLSTLIDSISSFIFWSFLYWLWSWYDFTSFCSGSLFIGATFYHPSSLHHFSIFSFTSRSC